MIEIIKLGYLQKYQIECTRCGTIFRFDESDLQISGFPGVPEIAYRIRCPICSEGISALSIKGFEKFKVTQEEMTDIE